MMTNMARIRTGVLLATVLVLAPFASPAYAARPDRTPPTRPGTPVVTDATESTISLSWRASRDNRGVAGYEVRNSVGNVVATSTGTGVTITGLRPATTRYYHVVGVDRAGNRSEPSGEVLAATGPDATPPTVPGTPTVVDVTAVDATITWGPSSDNSGGLQYHVYRDDPGAADPLVGMGSPGAPYVTVRGLEADTSYTYYVTAMDFTGNESAGSGRLTLRTLPADNPGPTCRVAFDIPTASGAPATFFGSFVVTNLTTETWYDFTIGFRFTAGQIVQPPLDGYFVQVGDAVTAQVHRSPASGAGGVHPGSTHYEMLIARHLGTNPPPADFTVNGQPCAVGPVRP